MLLTLDEGFFAAGIPRPVVMAAGGEYVCTRRVGCEARRASNGAAGGPAAHGSAAGPEARRAPAEQEWRAWELTRRLELATGTVEPRLTMAKAVGRAAANLIAAGGSYGIDGALDLLEVWGGTRIHPTAPLNLKSDSSPVAAQGRALVACRTIEHRLCSAASDSRHYQRAKATLSEQMAACRSRPADRVIVATPLARILEEAALLRPR